MMMRRAVAPRASTAPAVQLMSLLAFVTSSTVKRTRGDFSDCVLQCVLTRISVRLWLEKKIQFQSQSFDCIWENELVTYHPKKSIRYYKDEIAKVDTEQKKLVK